MLGLLVAAHVIVGCDGNSADHQGAQHAVRMFHLLKMKEKLINIYGKAVNRPQCQCVTITCVMLTVSLERPLLGAISQYPPPHTPPTTPPYQSAPPASPHPAIHTGVAAPISRSYGVVQSRDPQTGRVKKIGQSSG